jgi:RecQ-mediated genome instability protein 1
MFTMFTILETASEYKYDLGHLDGPSAVITVFSLWFLPLVLAFLSLCSTNTCISLCTSRSSKLRAACLSPLKHHLIHALLRHRQAMATPPQLTVWLDEKYPSPRVAPEWLDACFAWVVAEHNLDPAEHMPAIIEHVEAQLLQSELCDSMSHGTGIPLALLTAPSGTLIGPVLVQITAITEVGSSALSLEQVRVARAERLAAGADEGDGEDEADLEVDGEGPVPNYPRSMLRFELSDGATTLSAIEYRPLPELVLGVTPLGYKVRGLHGRAA